MSTFIASILAGPSCTRTSDVYDRFHRQIPAKGRTLPKLTATDQAVDRPKVMVISPMSPWPSMGGGELRTARFAEALSRSSTVRVLSLYAIHAPQPPEEIDEVVIRPGTPPQIWGYRSAERPLAPLLPRHLVKRIERHVAEFQPDIIVFEQTVTTGLLDQVDFGGAKLVLNSHNFDSDLASQIDRNVTWWSTEKSPQLALAQEKYAAQSCDLLVCCSDTDAGRFKEETGVSGMVIPNPLPDGRAFDLPIMAARYKNPDILFVGAMGYRPNRLAVEALVGTFAPALSEDATIRLVGRQAETLHADLRNTKNVEVTADPPEILPYLQNAGFTVMPITEGSGTRLKVLEAMAAGLVVIATSKAVEGLGLVPETHFALAETPDALLGRYKELAANPEASAAMAMSARQYVRDHYAEERFQQRVQEIFDYLRSTDRRNEG